MASTTRIRGHAGNAVAQLPFSVHIIQAPSQGVKLPTIGVPCLLLPQTRRVRREAEQTRQLLQVLGDRPSRTQETQSSGTLCCLSFIGSSHQMSWRHQSPGSKVGSRLTQGEVTKGVPPRQPQPVLAGCWPHLTSGHVFPPQ